MATSGLLPTRRAWLTGLAAMSALHDKLEAENEIELAKYKLADDQYDFLPNGLYVMKNYSGVIEVRFSPADSFDLSATSLQGRVFNEANLIPPAHNTHTSPRFARSLFGSVNQGRAKVEVTSFSGTINIRKRE